MVVDKVIEPVLVVTSKCNNITFTFSRQSLAEWWLERHYDQRIWQVTGGQLADKYTSAATIVSGDDE